MSKQRRSGRGAQPGERAGSVPDRARAAQGGHGNQAALEGLGAESSQVASSSVDEVRAVAVPMVARACHALSVQPREPAVVDKYVAILQGSSLGPDRRAALVDKLRADQDAALAARDAAARHFGPDGAEAALATLDRVWSGLAHGTHPPDGPHASARAEGWIAQLAGAELGPAVRAFCSEVYLLFAFEEEEEDEMLWVDGGLGLEG